MSSERSTDSLRVPAAVVLAVVTAVTVASATIVGDGDLHTDKPTPEPTPIWTPVADVATNSGNGWR
jgi:hypothetical protein